VGGPLAPTQPDDIKFFQQLAPTLIVRDGAGKERRLHKDDPPPAQPVTIVHIDFWPADATQVTDEALRRLAALTDLEQLRLHFQHKGGESPVTNKGRQQLGALVNLRALALTNYSKQLYDASFLVKLQRLEVLHLASSNFDWVRHAVQIPSLREIDLYQTLISEAELEQLAKLPRLTLLNLKAPGVSLASLKAFAAKCPWCKIVANSIAGVAGETTIEPTASPPGPRP
jgi:hypothetical protein